MVDVFDDARSRKTVPHIWMYYMYSQFVGYTWLTRFGHGTTVRSVQTLFTRRTAADRHTRITCSQDSNCDTKFFDFIVVGSGVAGLRYALEVSKYGSVAIITKAEPQESNTNYAQGGVSAVLCPSDSVESHMQDTIIAGAYLCDEETVRVVCTEGPDRVKELIAIGASFDHGDDGKLHLAREGGILIGASPYGGLLHFFLLGFRR
ncbi:L-aspartate oxidase, chloroplastic-like [Zingiber officinale]|uniref:L-aspartate oxidase, chloroplastic-like n=1 Tax=Zingiber officinale TaxID=94328 RepID=UPI001C4B7A61|nr:L-aspartate oxidase, chloroplastic-like [Zingiber officinale]